MNHPAEAVAAQAQSVGLPLSRITVLDLTLARAGPTCVRHLADWGANIIRIEPPDTGGEDVSGKRDGFDFQNLHRNKKFLKLNLKTPEGHAAFMKLAEKADVVIENMRAEVKHRLKVSYDDVKKVNPRIVYGSISGFGQSGPYGKRAGVDQIVQGMGGLMSITGEADGLPGAGPQRVGIPIIDMTTGMYATIAICAALAHRAVSGKGQWIDVALLDTTVAFLANQAMNYFATGESPKRIGNAHPNIVPYQTFKTQDGAVILACGNDNLFNKFCEAAGCTELLKNPIFVTNGDRVTNRVEVTRVLNEIFEKRTTAEWVKLLDDAGVANGPINTIAEVFKEPQVIARGLKIELPHAVAGKVPLVASPMRFSETPIKHEIPPPAVGQHTDEILREVLKKTDAEIAGLRGSGVV